MKSLKSKIIIGSSRLGSRFPFYLKFMNKNFLIFIDFAIKNNYSFFDTAFSYRFGNSQKNLDLVCKDHSETYISSKVGYLYGCIFKLKKFFLDSSENRINFKPDFLYKYINKKILPYRNSYFDILYLHSPSIEELAYINLQNFSNYLSNKFGIYKIGISTDSILNFIDTDFLRDVDVVQIPYYEYAGNSRKYQILKNKYNFKLYVNRIFLNLNNTDCFNYFYKHRFESILLDTNIDKIVIGITKIEHLLLFDKYLKYYDKKRK